MPNIRDFPGLSLVILVSASDSVFSGTEKRFLANLVARLSQTAPGALRTPLLSEIEEGQASQTISELTNLLSAQCGGFTDRQKQMEMAGAMASLLDEEEFLLWTGAALLTGDSDAQQSDFSEKANSLESEFMKEVIARYYTGWPASIEQLRAEALSLVSALL